MEIDPHTQSMEQNYKIITGLVVPRPVAWISTLAENGKVNLAPFSAVTFACQEPPMLAINFGPKGDGMRDTAANILRTGEFVVNIANQSLLHALHASSAVYPPEESEAETLGLATSESATVAPPRISAAPAGMECVLQKCIFLGERNYALIIGEVKRFFVRDDLVVNGKIATTALDPVVRIAGPTYARLGELITMPRAFPMPRENA